MSINIFFKIACTVWCVFGVKIPNVYLAEITFELWLLHRFLWHFRLITFEKDNTTAGGFSKNQWLHTFIHYFESLFANTHYFWIRITFESHYFWITLLLNHITFESHYFWTHNTFKHTLLLNSHYFIIHITFEFTLLLNSQYLRTHTTFEANKLNLSHSLPTSVTFELSYYSQITQFTVNVTRSREFRDLRTHITFEFTILSNTHYIHPLGL